MDRRTFFGVSGGILAASLADAQHQGKVWHVGVLFLAPSSSPSFQRGLHLFRQRLRELGYVDGKTIVFDERSAEGSAQRLSDLARELAARKVDVIVASAVAAATAARQATNAIPIVMVHAGNPVGAGLIASLARPGGNVTGTTNVPLGGKQVDLIREVVPRVAKLAILANPTNPGAASFVAAMTDAAGKSNIGVVVAEVTREEDFPTAFSVIRNARPDGLLVTVEPLISANDVQVIEFAVALRLPTVFDNGSQARRGGLIGYAPLLVEHYALAADYVDKILKGAKPGDLPVQQPDKFELVINMKTAKALGVTVPRTLLQRADEVIE